MPIQDSEGSLGNEPSSPSGDVPSVDIFESTDAMSLDPCVVQNEGPPALPLAGPDLRGWIPPRGRDLPGLLYVDASGTQPSGDALPSLLPSPILTMEDHVYDTQSNKGFDGSCDPKLVVESGERTLRQPENRH